MIKEKKYPKAIYNWPEDSPRQIVKDENIGLSLKINFISRGKRQRKRLLKFGADKLSDTELLSTLLRVGSSGKSVLIWQEN